MAQTDTPAPCVQIADLCLTPDDTTIMLTGNDLTALSDVLAATWISSIKLDGTGYTGPEIDLSPLNNMPELQSLQVSSLRGANWDSLTSSSVQSLNLAHNGNADYGFMSALPRLRFLRLDERLALSDLPRDLRARLETLKLSGPDLLSLNGGSDMTSLRILVLADASLSTLDGLGHLPALETLTILGDGVTSLDGFVPGPAFATLRAEGSSLQDISALATADNLNALHGKNSQINDISSLAGKHKIRQLFLTGTQVTDMSPLRALASLELLSLSRTPVTDITAFSDLPAIVAIWMNVTEVTDFTPLLENPNDIPLRINGDSVLMSSRLPEFIAKEGWKPKN
jgi:internalin A